MTMKTNRQEDKPSAHARKSRVVQRHEDSLRRAAEMRQRILDAAAAHFLMYGYEGTTMAGIAGELGLSAAALYWHFDSKTDLALAFVETSLEDTVAHVESELTAEGPEERLAQFVRAYVTHELLWGANLPAQDTLYRHGFQVLMEALPEAEKRHLHGLLRRPYEILNEILQAGLRLGVFGFEDRAVTAQFILTAIDYAFTWARPDGRLGPAEIAELHVNLVLRAVGAATPVRAHSAASRTPIPPQAEH